MCRKEPKFREVTTNSLALFHSLSGRGRAALLVSVDHAVARGDGQEHLQTGDKEASAEPRW